MDRPPSQSIHCSRVNRGCRPSVGETLTMVHPLECMGSLSTCYGGHVFLPKVVTPIYSEITQVGSWSSPYESVTAPCGQNYSEIVTLRMIGAGGVGENGVFHASCASPSVALTYQGPSVGRQTCPKGF